DRSGAGAAAGGLPRRAGDARAGAVQRRVRAAVEEPDRIRDRGDDRGCAGRSRAGPPGEPAQRVARAAVRVARAAPTHVHTRARSPTLGGDDVLPPPALSVPPELEPLRARFEPISSRHAL